MLLFRVNSLHRLLSGLVHQGPAWIPGACQVPAGNPDPGPRPGPGPGTLAGPESLNPGAPGTRELQMIQEVYRMFSGWRPEEKRIGLMVCVAALGWAAAVLAAVTMR